MNRDQKISNLKLTRNRNAVLNVFSNQCAILSAATIFKKLKRTGIDLATVYRTLKYFEEHGAIKRVVIDSKEVLYERSTHHHHHIICTQCNSVESFEHCNMNSLITKTLSESKKFKEVTDHSLELFGICKQCQ